MTTKKSLLNRILNADTHYYDEDYDDYCDYDEYDSNSGCGEWSCDECPNVGCPSHPLN